MVVAVVVVAVVGGGVVAGVVAVLSVVVVVVVEVVVVVVDGCSASPSNSVSSKLLDSVAFSGVCVCVRCLLAGGASLS